jgi:membrane-associated phospholipid phosphatase
MENALTDVSAVRRANLGALNRFSHGWNTFPSGHVAVSLATALSVLSVSVSAGLVLLLMAVGISVGAVWGRYHYSIDAAAGAIVAVVAVLLASTAAA